MEDERKSEDEKLKEDKKISDNDLSTLFKDISEVLKAQSEEISNLKKQLEEFKPPVQTVTSDDFKSFKQEMTDILQTYNRSVNTSSESENIDFDTMQMNLLNRRF